LAWIGLSVSLAIAFGSTPARAAEPVRIGVLAEFSGPFAAYGRQIRGGMKAYLKLHGDTIAGRKIEILVMNAASSIITTKSPYIARFSMTLPQVTEPIAIWAAKNGILAQAKSQEIGPLAGGVSSLAGQSSGFWSRGRPIGVEPTESWHIGLRKVSPNSASLRTTTSSWRPSRIELAS